MSTRPFASYAQNGEDVVLWRALSHIEHGRYVDVGANDPTHESISRAFYDAGWRGITIEPMPKYAAMHREQRPEDILIEAVAVAHSNGTTTLHEIPETGLSTLLDDVNDRHSERGFESHDITVATTTLDDVLAEAGWADLDIHFLSIDVEGAEKQVLMGLNLLRWRPWVLVIEATAPLTTVPSHSEWEPLVRQAGYDFCLFDGLSRFYVAHERAEQLGPALSYPATLLDDYSTIASRSAGAEITRLHRELDETHARLHELQREHDELSGRYADLAQTHHETVTEVSRLTSTVSWRVTKPLRSIRSRIDRSSNSRH